MHAVVGREALRLWHLSKSMCITAHELPPCDLFHWVTATEELTWPCLALPRHAVLCCAVVSQLNAAATEVTRLHGLPVIDLGGMVFGLEPKKYLDDQHHPNKARAVAACAARYFIKLVIRLLEATSL
jgi:hypothetical protein